MKLFRIARRVAIALVLTASLVSGGGVRAQEIERIAAVVNDDAISVFDLVQRIKLVIFSSGLPNTPEVMQKIGPQVLRALIDEKLRLQEAKRQKITVSDAELKAALAQIERGNRIPLGTLKSYLRARGIDPETVIEQVRAQIAWSKLVARRRKSELKVSEDEVDAEIKRIEASRGSVEYRVSEIFLAVESEDQEARVLADAVQLVGQLRAGADFAALARQFSAGATAGTGGDLGWVTKEQLADRIAEAVARLKPGEISDPVRGNGGYEILRLVDRRRRMEGNPDDTKVALRQVLLTLPEVAADGVVREVIDRANAIRATIRGCQDMSRVAAKVDPSVSGDVGTVRLGDLPAPMREVVRALPVGQVSAPLRTQRGVHLLMVCGRQEVGGDLPSRATVRRQLEDRRFDLVSRRYLRDIRRDAFVDVRI